MRKLSEYGFRAKIYADIETDLLTVVVMQNKGEGKHFWFGISDGDVIANECFPAVRIPSSFLKVQDTGENQDMLITLARGIMEYFDGKTDSDKSDLLRGRINEMENTIEYLKDLNMRQLRFLEDGCKTQK